MTINVLGATGQLGRKVIQALLNQGAAPSTLIASVRTPEKARSLLEQGITVRKADYDDPASLQAAFQDTDVLLLIPSTAPVEPRILQHYNALDAARQCGVGRIVLSSFATAAHPDSRFHITPFMVYAEMKLRQSGIAWTILRNGMYLDPIADWAPELVQMGRLPYPVIKGRVAYVSRHDLARATAEACLQSTHAGRIYELTGAAALSMPELAEAVSKATGASITFDSITDEDFADICRKGEERVPEPVIRILTSMYHAVDNGELSTLSHHIEVLTDTPPETVQHYLHRKWKDRL